MRNLLSPDKPGDKRFSELVELLKNHYIPTPSEIVQRFKFNSLFAELSCPPPSISLRGEGGITSNSSQATEKHRSAHHISDTEEATASDRQEVFTMYSVVETQIPRVSPITMLLKVNDTEVNFEVDTGCSVTIMSKTEYAKLGSVGKLPVLKDCSLSLKTYTGESVKILEATDVIVRRGNQVRELPVVVVSTDGPNLLGRG